MMVGGAFLAFVVRASLFGAPPHSQLRVDYSQLQQGATSTAEQDAAEVMRHARVVDEATRKKISSTGWDSSMRDNSGSCTDTEEIKHTAPVSSCGNDQVVKLVDMINAINAAGITIFPRNGLLLGIVRHGGFLPSEKIDVDLGILYSDLDKIKSGPEIQGKEGVYTFKIGANGKWGKGWNGTHPFTGEVLPEDVVVYLNGKPVLAKAKFYFPYKANVLFYPFYCGPHNEKGRLVETRRFITEGSSASVLGQNEGASFEIANGELGNLFAEQDFKTTTEVPFYEYTINIPAGFGCMLTNHYGVHWRTQIEKRVNWESQIVGNNGTEGSAEHLYEPKKLCT